MLRFAWRLLNPVFDWRRSGRALREYPRFFGDWRRYRRLGGGAPATQLYPQLHDHDVASPYDPHYFYQDVWAAQRVAEHRPSAHVDIGSRVDLVGFLTALTDVTFVDIRPLEANLERLTSVAGSVLGLPFADSSLPSVSCLHVAEHIGLGRYGDPLDPQGTRRAAAELQRVIAEDGQLLFSTPVGTPRTNFNAHRIHAPAEIVAMFGDLELVEFSGIDDSGQFSRHRELSELRDADYACGLFLFRRPAT